MSARSMSIGHVWFSFQGRMNRKVWWLWYFLPILVLTIVFNILDGLLGTFYMVSPEVPLGYFSTAFGLLSMWIGLAAGAKRCHDRGRSGWFQLLYLIPFFGAIFMFVYVGFLAGTEGENRFGPDPLAGGGYAPEGAVQHGA